MAGIVVSVPHALVSRNEMLPTVIDAFANQLSNALPELLYLGFRLYRGPPTPERADDSVRLSTRSNPSLHVIQP